MILEGEEAGIIAFLQETSITAQVAIVRCVDGVMTRLLTELEGEKCGRTPRDVGIDMDFITGITQVSKASPSNGAQVHLRSGS